MKPETALAKLDQASKMLAEVRDADDAKHVAAVAEAALAYSRKMNLGIEAIGRAVEVRADATRLLGGFLSKMPKSKGGRPGKTGTKSEPVYTLAELGLDKKQSANAQKLAKMPAREFAAFRKRLVEIATGIKIPKQPELEIDDTGECYTPEEWPDRARDVMGGIDLDPFSCVAANRLVKADAFYTAEDSALDHDWVGRIWWQPPYDNQTMTDATTKLLHEIDQQRVTACIGLTNTCSTSPWWQTLAERAVVVMFPRHRINFYRPAGGDEVVQQKGNRADQTFFYFGTDPHRFRYVFGEFGIFGSLRGNLSAS